jgi:nucleoid DNA-binding protein
MNKPASMSHKEWMIKRLSIQLVISEKIIDAVINNQFDTAHDALVNNNSIEFSGFGKFVFNVKRAEKRMLKFESQKAAFALQLEDETLTASMRIKVEKRLETALDNIKALAPKLK